MKHFWILVLGFGLLACITSESRILTASVETEAAVPTATLTPKPTATDVPTLTPLPSATEDMCDEDELSSWSVPAQLAVFQMYQLIREAEEMSDEEWVANASRFQESVKDAHDLYDALAEKPPPCAEEAERLLQVYLYQLEDGWEATAAEDFRKANIHFDAAFDAFDDFIEIWEELGLLDQ